MDKYEYKTYGETTIYLPAGNYTKTDLQAFLNAFDDFVKQVNEQLANSMKPVVKVEE